MIHQIGKFVKIEIDSFYGTGGGLVYLDVKGKNAPSGINDK